MLDISLNFYSLIKPSYLIKASLFSCIKYFCSLTFYNYSLLAFKYAFLLLMNGIYNNWWNGSNIIWLRLFNRSTSILSRFLIRHLLMLVLLSSSRIILWASTLLSNLWAAQFYWINIILRWMLISVIVCVSLIWVSRVIIITHCFDWCLWGAAWIHINLIDWFIWVKLNLAIRVW